MRTVPYYNRAAKSACHAQTGRKPVHRPRHLPQTAQTERNYPALSVAFAYSTPVLLMGAASNGKHPFVLSVIFDDVGIISIFLASGIDRMGEEFLIFLENIKQPES